MAFGVLAEYATAAPTQDMELARMDADNRLDLVLIENSKVTIRLGQAGGSFGSPLGTTGDILAQRVVTGDFNNDGRTDLLTSHFNQLSLRLGNGDATFQAPRAFGLPPQVEPLAVSPIKVFDQYIGSVATGDINGDGKLDLVVGATTSFPDGFSCGYYTACDYTWSYSGYINVLLGTGAGGLDYVDADPSDGDRDAHALGNWQSASALAIVDVNHDGRRDVVASKSYGGLAALLGNGTGALQNAIHSGSGSGFLSISLGDLDGDGNLDTVTRTGDRLIVQEGRGNGNFVPGAVMDAGQKMASAVIGDVNGDGKLDLVAVGVAPCTSYDYYGGCYDTTRTRQTSVLLGDGQGAFSLPIVSSLGVVNSGYSSMNDLALADLTGDGRGDLVTIDGGLSGAAIVAANDGQWVTPAAVSISDATVVEGDSGTGDAVFTVTLSRPLDQEVTVDYYTATAHTSDIISASGTLRWLVGETSKTITVQVVGDLLDEELETFNVFLTNPSPNVLILDNAGDGYIEDNDPTPTVSINDVSKSEGNSGTTAFQFTLGLSAPSGREIYVEYATADGTATTANQDYVAKTGHLVYFVPGTTIATLSIDVKGDYFVEADETFFVNLVSAGNATIADGQGVGTIVNDDSGTSSPSISISDASVVEGNSGTKLMTFTISLSHTSSQQVKVNYATANGTAKTSDKDYVFKSGTITFAPGQTTQTITVTIKGDRKWENDEIFYVKLSKASGGSIADGQGVGTILNDDGTGAGGKRLASAAVDAALGDWLKALKNKNGRR